MVEQLDHRFYKSLYHYQYHPITVPFSSPTFLVLFSSQSERYGVESETLNQFTAKAKQASQFVAKSGNEYYKNLMEKNKKYVANPPTIEKCQELSKQLFYTRLASMPSRYESFWKELDGVKQLLKTKKELKVEDAGIAVMFGVELYLWFIVGEIIGRGFTITGYKV